MARKREWQKGAYLDRLSGVVLGSPEDEALGDALAAQLVNLDHSAEGDQADKGVRRQETQGHLEKRKVLEHAKLTETF